MYGKLVAGILKYIFDSAHQITIEKNKMRGSIQLYLLHGTSLMFFRDHESLAIYRLLFFSITT